MSQIAASVSVIVVSRHRPKALLRCLTGLRQLFYPRFEVIVVADPGGIAAVERAGILGDVKHAVFDQANISAARNIGIGLAAGDVVAFIDDDAVPEPTWLDHLAAPFTGADIHAAGGYVIGRNGISFQSTGRRVNHLGVHSPLALPDMRTAHFNAGPGDAVKTEGTNCAFRRDTLIALGGFDTAFHFYLDETDLNLRIAARGYKTAIVPLAQVHHGFASSAQRGASRMPKTLFDVGASLVVFLRKHASADDIAPALDAMRAEQRARLIRHMVAGTCEPGDVGRVMNTLEAGFKDGGARDFGRGLDAPLDRPPLKVMKIFANTTAPSVIAGRIWQSGALRQKARQQAVNGHRVSFFCFSPTSLYHRVTFVCEGYWHQTGGLFGRSLRSDPIVKLWRFADRLKREMTRVHLVRGLKMVKRDEDD